MAREMPNLDHTPQEHILISEIAPVRRAARVLEKIMAGGFCMIALRFVCLGAKQVKKEKKPSKRVAAFSPESID
jgi:hypothetical protein